MFILDNIVLDLKERKFPNFLYLQIARDSVISDHSLVINVLGHSLCGGGKRAWTSSSSGMNPDLLPAKLP